MANTYICPICGCPMFYDKGNHIIFCAECDHVGWPHDVPVSHAEPAKDATATNLADASTPTGEKRQKQ